MKKIGLREFRNNMKDYLDKLPVALTRYEEVVARVVPPTDVKVEQETLAEKKEEKKEEKKDSIL